MRAVVTRVKSASVEIDGNIVGKTYDAHRVIELLRPLLEILTLDVRQRSAIDSEKSTELPFHAAGLLYSCDCC